MVEDNNKPNNRTIIQRRDDKDLVSIGDIRRVAQNDIRGYFAPLGATEEQLNEIYSEVDNIINRLEAGTLNYNGGSVKGGFYNLKGEQLTNKKDLKKGQLDTTGYAAGFVGNIIRALEAYKEPEKTSVLRLSATSFIFLY